MVPSRDHHVTELVILSSAPLIRSTCVFLHLVMTVNETKMLVIYGSQTGQSKSIAENLASEAGNRNYNIELLSMEDAAEKVSNLKVQFFLSLNKCSFCLHF